MILNAAPANVAWPEVYEGNGGVKLTCSEGSGLLRGAPNGAQVGSGIVLGLPSSAALRMATMGRQNMSRYLIPQHWMPASAMAMLISANIRALSPTELPSCSAMTRAI